MTALYPQILKCSDSLVRIQFQAHIPPRPYTVQFNNDFSFLVYVLYLVTKFIIKSEYTICSISRVPQVININPYPTNVENRVSS